MIEKTEWDNEQDYMPENMEAIPMQAISIRESAVNIDQKMLFEFVKQACKAAMLELGACTKESTHEDESWMSVPEVASYLGLTEKAVRDGARLRSLPGKKYPPNSTRGRWRFRRVDIDKMLNKQRKQTVAKSINIWE